MTNGRETLLLIGYRAYGDWLYAIPALPQLFSKYDVVLEMNTKGYELFHDDPRFKAKMVYNIEKYLDDNEAERKVNEHWDKLIADIKPDKVINLWRSLETSCISEAYMPIHWADAETRREAYGDKSFADAAFERLECTIPDNFDNGGLYFTDRQIEVIGSWRKKHTGQFVVMMPLAGSSSHKDLPILKDVALHIVNRYPNAFIYLMGDESLSNYPLHHERIKSLCGVVPYKQACLMTKSADLVIGPETGLLVAAGMYGAHKICLCTASGINQIAKYHRNDYSIQADIACSPCHRAVYTVADCENIVDNGDMPYPKCAVSFDFDKIVLAIEQVYNHANIYNISYISEYTKRADSDKGRRIYQSRWDLVEKYCSGHMTLLDYGCATGAFHKSSSNGFQCFGFDVNPYSEFNREYDNSIDILTMWDVIEHLNDPLEPIRKYKPKWLFVSTPNAAAVNGDLKHWKHYKPGEHIWYFDPISITKLLNDGGYIVREVNYSEGAIRDAEVPENIMSIVAERQD